MRGFYEEISHLKKEDDLKKQQTFQTIQRSDRPMISEVRHVLEKHFLVELEAMSEMALLVMMLEYQSVLV